MGIDLRSFAKSVAPHHPLSVQVSLNWDKEWSLVKDTRSKTKALLVHFEQVSYIVLLKLVFLEPIYI